MIEAQIEKLLSAPLEGLGFEFIKSRLYGEGKGRALQVLVERIDGTPLTVGDLQELSRHISGILDVEDIIKERYLLEISSAGLDRPLTKRSDFTKYMGFLIKLKLKNPLEGGAKKAVARLEEFSEDGQIKAYSEAEKRHISFNYDDIDSANIVITDALLKSKGKMN